jgi:hypothetical protein
MTYYLKRIINEFFLKASFISALPNYLTDGTNTLGMIFFSKKVTSTVHIICRNLEAPTHFATKPNYFCSRALKEKMRSSLNTVKKKHNYKMPCH